MQRSNISRYFSEDVVFGYLASDDKKEEEINNSDCISTNDGKKDREELSPCYSSFEEEMNDQLCSSASANYIVSNQSVANKTFCK